MHAHETARQLGEEAGTIPRSRGARLLASPWLRLGVLALLLGVALTVAARADELSLGAVRAFVADLGVVGPLLFVAVYAVAGTALLPGAPFTLAAGLLFGPALGTLTALVGATAGATGAFYLGRLLGRGAVEQVGGRRVAAVDRFLAERGFVALLLVRLVPLFPFNLVNVTSGVTSIATRDYVLATAVGIIPGTFAYAALGGTVDDPLSPAFAGALAVFLVVTVGAWLLSRRLRRRTVADTL